MRQILRSLVDGWIGEDKRKDGLCQVPREPDRWDGLGSGWWWERRARGADGVGR